MDSNAITFRDWLHDNIEGHFHGVPYIACLFDLYQLGHIPAPEYDNIKEHQAWAYDCAIQLKLAVEKDIFINNLIRTPLPERAGLIEDEKSKITERLNHDANAKQAARIGKRACGQISGSTYHLIKERWECYQRGEWDYSIDTTLTVHHTERGKQLNKGFYAAFKLRYLRWLEGINEVGLPQDTEQVKKAILPAYHEQFKEIEGALLQQGWINLKREWLGQKKSLVFLIKLLWENGYFRQIEKKPNPQQPTTLQNRWIAQRYMGEETALDQIAKKYIKATYKAAYTVFSYHLKGFGLKKPD